jgi:hypothetical protein
MSRQGKSRTMGFTFSAVLLKMTLVLIIQLYRAEYIEKAHNCGVHVFGKDRFKTRLERESLILIIAIYLKD